MPTLPWRNKRTGTEPARAQSTSQASQDATDADPPRRQSSIPWLNRSDSTPRNNSTASEHRTSRQRSIASLPFLRKRKSPSVVAEACFGAHQTGCSLIARLPYELRESIYLLLGQDEEWAVPLREVPDSPVDRKRIQKMRKKGGKGAQSTAYGTLISLMRTCRTIHGEMMPLLFTKSHVHCSSLLTFNYFTTTVSIDRWSTLRRLTLHALFPYLLFHEREGGPREDKADPNRMQHYNAKIWDATCKSLSAMSRLRELRIKMSARDYRDMHPGWPDRPSERLEKCLFRPLMDITWCEVFDVEVSWPVSDEEGVLERDVDSAPFVLRMMKEADEEEEDGRSDESDGSASDSDDGAAAFPAPAPAPVPAPAVQPAYGAATMANFVPAIPTAYGW